MFTHASLCRHKKLLLLMLLGMCCRSVVAAGFMLDMDPADGSLVSVKICPGPFGIDAIAGFEQTSSHPHHPGHHDSAKHEHSSHDGWSSSCSLWSASGLLLVCGGGAHALGLINTNQGPIDFVARVYGYTFPRFGSAREPPVLS